MNETLHNCLWLNNKLYIAPHLELLITDDDKPGFKHIFDEDKNIVGVEISQRCSEWTLFFCPLFFIYPNVSL